MTDEAAPEVLVPIPDAEPVVDKRREFVEIVNPATAGSDTSRVSRLAYEETWAAKGWRVVVGKNDEGALLLEPALVIEEDPEGEATDLTGDGGGSTGSTGDEALASNPEASAGTDSEAEPKAGRLSR